MENVQKARDEDRKRTIAPFLFQACFACCKKTFVGCSFVGGKYVPHETCELSDWNTKPWSSVTYLTKSRPYALRRSALHEHCWNVVSVRPFKCGVLHGDAKSYYIHHDRSLPLTLGTTMFWDESFDSIRNFWSLTELMRCRDSWYNSFLQQCRHGCLPVDFYFFAWLTGIHSQHAKLFMQ